MLVGPDEERFQVCKDVLCQSKVLGAMCLLDCQERDEKIIRLPEDDVDIFLLLLEYLFSGDYSTDSEKDFKAGEWEFKDDPGFDSSTEETRQESLNAITASDDSQVQSDTLFLDNQAGVGPNASNSELESHAPMDAVTQPQSAEDNQIDWEFEIALEHISIYVLADKYDLKELKELARQNMWKHIHTWSDHLGLAATIYPHIAEGDDVFRPFLIEHLPGMIMRIQHEHPRCSRAIIAHYLDQGEMLKEDLTWAIKRLEESDELTKRIWNLQISTRRCWTRGSYSDCPHWWRNGGRSNWISPYGE